MGDPDRHLHRVLVVSLERIRTHYAHYPGDRMKPFLKWAGGKHSQINQIVHHLPKGERLIEPFVGAGSVFMNSGFQDVVLNDVNPDLINLYSILKHQGQRLLDEAERLCKWVNSEERYYAVLDRFNTREYTHYSMAAFFLVLNRTCFNGLCRYNQQRQFNVPWGKKEQCYFPRAELEEYLASGFNPQLFCTDFATIFGLCRSGDVIFCDPPYHPLPGKDGFTTYSGKKFDLNDQKRLVDMAIMAKGRGVPTVITNSAAPIIIDMYQKAGFTIHELTARRSISAGGDQRGEVKDIIAVLK